MHSIPDFHPGIQWRPRINFFLSKMLQLADIRFIVLWILTFFEADTGQAVHQQNILPGTQGKRRGPPYWHWWDHPGILNHHCQTECTPAALCMSAGTGTLWQYWLREADSNAHWLHTAELWTKPANITIEMLQSSSVSSVIHSCFRKLLKLEKLFTS